VLAKSTAVNASPEEMAAPDNHFARESLPGRDSRWLVIRTDQGQ
jgi:hypothetical protein